VEERFETKKEIKKVNLINTIIVVTILLSSTLTGIFYDLDFLYKDDTWDGIWVVLMYINLILVMLCDLLSLFVIGWSFKRVQSATEAIYLNVDQRMQRLHLVAFSISVVVILAYIMDQTGLVRSNLIMTISTYLMSIVGFLAQALLAYIFNKIVNARDTVCDTTLITNSDLSASYLDDDESRKSRVFGKTETEYLYGGTED
jgi:hypothetical protein